MNIHVNTCNIIVEKWRGYKKCCNFQFIIARWKKRGNPHLPHPHTCLLCSETFVFSANLKFLPLLNPQSYLIVVPVRGYNRILLLGIFFMFSCFPIMHSGSNIFFCKEKFLYLKFILYYKINTRFPKVLVNIIKSYWKF